MCTEILRVQNGWEWNTIKHCNSVPNHGRPIGRQCWHFPRYYEISKKDVSDKKKCFILDYEQWYCFIFKYFEPKFQDFMWFKVPRKNNTVVSLFICPKFIIVPKALLLMNKLFVLQEKFIGRNWSRAPRTDSILKPSQKLSYKEYRTNEMPFRCTTQSIQRKLFTLFIRQFAWNQVFE